jgi:predicted DCC family thiol-disulfide oxidoreductase YuxK
MQDKILSMNKDRAVLLFDGECNLCNSLVQFIIRKDHKKKFLFASLQSNAAESLLIKHSLPVKKNNSFVYIVGEKHYVKSTAALLVARELNGITRLLYGFIIIPLPIRDFVYDLVAKYRFRLFGKTRACLAESEHIHRFLV